MSDQPNQGVEDLAELLSDDPIKETEELEEDEHTSDDDGQLEDDEDADDEDEADEPDDEEEQAKGEKFKLTVKNEQGEDEEKELTLEELAEGYMLSSDYTRKRQSDAATEQQRQTEYLSNTQRVHQQSAEQIEQLKAFVVNQVSPQLQQLTPQLAQTDPALYIQLQAEQQQAQQTLQQLDQVKRQSLEQASQAENAARTQRLDSNREYLQSHVPEYGKPEYQDKIMNFAEKTYGISKSDLMFLTNAPAFKEGGILDSGVVVHLLNDAMKYRNLETQKPIQMKKVKSAPKVIRPNAPQPKNRTRNKEASNRLAKFGRVEDLAEFL